MSDFFVSEPKYIYIPEIIINQIEKNLNIKIKRKYETIKGMKLVKVHVKCVETCGKKIYNKVFSNYITNESCIELAAHGFNITNIDKDSTYTSPPREISRFLLKMLYIITYAPKYNGNAVPALDKFYRIYGND